MKKTLPILLIISFLSIGVFGLTFFDHTMMSSSNNNCVASTLGETECPTSIVGMVFHHVSVVQTLTTTLPSSSSWFSVLASLLLVSVGIFLFYKDLLFPKPVLSPQHLKNLSLNYLRSRQKIVSWLSLFELSPAL